MSFLTSVEVVPARVYVPHVQVVPARVHFPRASVHILHANVDSLQALRRDIVAGQHHHHLAPELYTALLVASQRIKKKYIDFCIASKQTSLFSTPKNITFCKQTVQSLWTLTLPQKMEKWKGAANAPPRFWNAFAYNTDGLLSTLRNQKNGELMSRP